MKYIPPEVGDNKVVYKGKRYWIIEFTGKDKIDGFGRDNCQFIIYDKDYRAILAYIDFKNGEYCAKLAWAIDDFTINTTLNIVLVEVKGIKMSISIYKNFNTNRQELETMFETTSKSTIWINRFIPLMFSNIKDANAIVLKISTGFFSSRILSNDEHSMVVNDLLNLGFKQLTYSKDVTGTLIVDTLNDSLGCLVDVHKQIKMMPTRFKIKLGISYIDRDRAVIVKEKFWDNEDSRPKGYHFIEDLT